MSVNKLMQSMCFDDVDSEEIQNESSEEINSLDETQSYSGENPYTEEDSENTCELEKNMQNEVESQTCCKTLIDLFILKIVIPIFFFFMNISFFYKVYPKEFISICVFIFGLILIAFYVYYITRSTCSTQIFFKNFIKEN